MTEQDIKRILALVIIGDPSAAAEIHKLADELRALALRLESSNPNKSTGGMEDRVRMQVVGPDGQVKQDTNPKGE